MTGGRRIQCRKCGDIIQSMHRHDLRSCKCNAIFVDGGSDYLRCGGKDLDDIIFLDKEEELDD